MFNKDLSRLCSAGNQFRVTPFKLGEGGVLSLSSGKELCEVHGCFSSQSFWKAESARSESQSGSSLKSAGVMGNGK